MHATRCMQGQVACIPVDMACEPGKADLRLTPYVHTGAVTGHAHHTVVVQMLEALCAAAYSGATHSETACAWTAVHTMTKHHIVSWIGRPFMPIH